MRVCLKNLLKERSGTTAIEYALIASLIAMVMLPAIGPITDALVGVFQQLSTAAPQP
ncbi:MULTISPECIES: Flp family type IVb pilin [Phenylobacterium]|uniref:Flp pilus assembly pilin Flp n=1 Tax=Phenylobacterium koreense TaxID=266125 RepID=A0ABV2EGR4_9CAUL